MKKNKMRGTFCCLAMKVAIAFYKTYVILFYYEVLKHYGISHKRVLLSKPKYISKKTKELIIYEERIL